MFSANSFALSNAEGSTSRLINRQGIADLPLLRTLNVPRAELLGSDFFYSFVLLAYASLAASRTLLQRLLACLNFTLDSEDLFCWYN